MTCWKSTCATGLLWLLLAVQNATSESLSIITVPKDKAVFLISLPTLDAAVKFDNVLTGETGFERLFFSPILKDGQAYEYRIEVSWYDNNQEKKE
jgi:uncharacterized protein (TIGR03000 family)